MAELRLSRAEVREANFPRLCMQCGAVATDEELRTYSTDQAAIPVPPAEPLGCFVLWPILGLIKLLSWSTAITMTVPTPLCHKHAHGWFNWSPLEARAISEDHILLEGVSEAFVSAWEKQRKAFPHRHEWIRIRCRACQAVNDEEARFCNQCGQGL